MLRSLLFITALVSSTAALSAPDKVIPFEGVLDKNGAPFSGAATMNFALFACPTGNCAAQANQLWVASGSGAFPPSAAPGISVTANGGRFSVLLGDTGQAALDPSVWRTPQLHVRVAVKGGDTWVALTGFQRVAPATSAITAEEAATFTVRENLQVNGNATVNNNINVGSFNDRGNADIDGTLNVDGGSLVGTLELRGTANSTNVIKLNNQMLQLRGGTDTIHRLQYGTSFGGLNADGPQLIGFSGGILGTSDGGPRGALRWDTGGVTVNGNMAASSISTTGNITVDNGSYRRKNDDLFVVCERTTEGGRGAGLQEIVFDNASFCGGHAPPSGSEWVGALGALDICGQANNVDVTLSPARVRWFQGSGCGAGSFRVKAIYMRIK